MVGHGGHPIRSVSFVRVPGCILDKNLDGDLLIGAGDNINGSYLARNEEDEGANDQTGNLPVIFDKSAPDYDVEAVWRTIRQLLRETVTPGLGHGYPREIGLVSLRYEVI